MSAILLLAATAHAWSWTDPFPGTIQKVEQMVWDSQVQSTVARYGLDVVNVTWEDTGRFHGSAVGPNISDMTIGVRDYSGQLHPMPVIRFDNFTDKTADLRTSELWLKMGNERGRSPRPVAFSEVLRNTRAYLHDSGSWAGWASSMAADRDSHVLVSAQACFLPIPQSGQATFTPVIYNYQSYPGNPAVLAIVATSQGTSMQVVENEGGYLSEALYFNDNGQRAPFTAERLSDWKKDKGITGPVPQDNGMDTVLLIQIPLKQKAPPPPQMGYGGYDDYDMAAPAAESAAKSSTRSDVEQAVVGYGPAEGPFHEMNGLAVERDPRFPIRVTVQFYKATSNGVVSERDIADIRQQIDRVYANADWVGSLVVGGPIGRPTEWQQPTPPVTRTDDGNATWASGFWDWHKAW